MPDNDDYQDNVDDVGLGDAEPGDIGEDMAENDYGCVNAPRGNLADGRDFDNLGTESASEEDFDLTGILVLYVDDA